MAGGAGTAIVRANSSVTGRGGGRATGSDDTAGAAGVGAAMGAGAAGATVFPVNRETFLEMNALGRAARAAPPGSCTRYQSP
jgi:hypothetical protein